MSANWTPNGGAPARPAAAVAHRAGQGDIIIVVPGPVFIRPGLAIAGDGAVNQPWIDGFERFIANAQSLHHARAELLNDDVISPAIGGHQPFDDLDGCRLFQIQGDGSFIAIQNAVPGRSFAIERRQKAHGVGAMGRFHAHHIRTHVGQHHRGKRAGQQGGKVEDFEGGEGSWHGEFMIED